MKLQTKVTLGSVLLATTIVVIVSSVDLYGVMQLRLQSTYDRAELIKDAALVFVTDTVNSHRDLSLSQALEDEDLNRRLFNLMRSPNGLLSVDVVTPRIIG